MAKAGRPAQNRQSMVEMLVEAALIGDVASSKKYGVTRQTLLNYRKLLKDDPSFFALFEQTANNLVTRPWAEDLDDALRRTVKKMLELVEEQVALPESLEAVVKAFSAMAELQLAREVMNVGDGHADAAATTTGAKVQAAASRFN